MQRPIFRTSSFLLSAGVALSFALAGCQAKSNTTAGTGGSGGSGGSAGSGGSGGTGGSGGSGGSGASAGSGGSGGSGASAGSGGSGGQACPPGPEGEGDTCTNGCDDDGNGFTDCDDFACQGSANCPIEGSNPACTNGLDDDDDGFVDCDDISCKDVGACAKERSNFACSDGIDNDGDAGMADGGVDCADKDCQGEGIVVCNGSIPANPLPLPSDWKSLIDAECSNDADDDGNMFSDCGDFGCSKSFEGSVCLNLAAEVSTTLCADGLDNDADGKADCEDPDCQREGVVVCNGTTPVMVDPAMYGALSDAACSNGVDDGMANNKIDCQDFGCLHNADVSVCKENNDAECSDGIDNDGNGFSDCKDFSCSKNPNVTVCETSFAQCSDGIDNDGDGFADCGDFKCNPMNGPKSPACN
jgi:hypothetical protein